jgi:hypothetical protein
VTNRQDLVPTVPGRFLGFEHPAGQVHIISDGNAVACAGDENDSTMCTDGAVPNILEGSILDHLGACGCKPMLASCAHERLYAGPYEGINIGTLFCT